MWGEDCFCCKYDSGTLCILHYATLISKGMSNFNFQTPGQNHKIQTSPTSTQRVQIDTYLQILVGFFRCLSITTYSINSWRFNRLKLRERRSGEADAFHSNFPPSHIQEIHPGHPVPNEVMVLHGGYKGSANILKWYFWGYFVPRMEAITTHHPTQFISVSADYHLDLQNAITFHKMDTIYLWYTRRKVIIALNAPPNWNPY